MANLSILANRKWLKSTWLTAFAGSAVTEAWRVLNREFPEWNLWELPWEFPVVLGILGLLILIFQGYFRVWLPFKVFASKKENRPMLALLFAGVFLILGICLLIWWAATVDIRPNLTAEQSRILDKIVTKQSEIAEEQQRISRATNDLSEEVKGIGGAQEKTDNILLSRHKDPDRRAREPDEIRERYAIKIRGLRKHLERRKEELHKQSVIPDIAH